jgi:DNA invertase Pin-like site-specific DNA recombinase
VILRNARRSSKTRRVLNALIDLLDQRNSGAAPTCAPQQLGRLTSEALKLCRLHGATLVIAKLDRLARNVAFISNLMESGVEFHAVDFPQANRLTVHILAAVAEHEAKAISERTKAALAAAKRRGVKLGGYRGTMMTKAMRKAASEAITKRAKARAADLAPTIAELQAAGATSLRAIAAGLNERGIPTARGTGTWSATQVMRVLARW